MRIASTAVLVGLAGSVAAVLVLGLVGNAPAAGPSGPEPRAKVGELVVAVHLAAPGLRAGALRGRDVVAASGLEVDVARALARRMGATRVRFVNVPDPAALTRPGRKTWDLAFAGIDSGLRGDIDVSAPYLRSDPVVLLRAGLPRPRTLADLRLRLLCAVTGSRGAAVARTVADAFTPVLAPSDAALLDLVQTGRCDAAVREAPLLGTARERVGGRYGPLGGRIDTGVGWVVALPAGSELRPQVDRALARLRADGTLGRLARRWLGFDPSALRVLR